VPQEKLVRVEKPANAPGKTLPASPATSRTGSNEKGVLSDNSAREFLQKFMTAYADWVEW